MEHLHKALEQIRSRVWLVSLLMQLATAGVCVWLYLSGIMPILPSIGLYALLSIFSTLIAAAYAARLARIPLEAMGNAILHVSPSQNAPAAPQTDSLRIGREYVTNLVYQLYQVASMQDNKLMAEHKRAATQASDILTHLPLPVLVFNKQGIVTFGTDAALSYCGINSAQLFGKPLTDAIDLEFGSDFTLESWSKDCQQNKATDTAYWRQVRMHTKTDAAVLRQFDMAGYYNRDNPAGIEFIITMFDRTQEYAEEDKTVGFVAMAIHELRTPLTLMRGYIEVFEDELAGKLDPEMTNFMRQMHIASQQLPAFVNNILNVARIEENQLSVRLGEENWENILQTASKEMQLRAAAVGKVITFNIEPHLPAVAVDRMSVYEVISNLLDNALKYSGDSPEVKVSAYQAKDGMIETVIQDTGLGIPSDVIPTLFEKFHRNHRNKAQVSGTGLGLYLSKAIISAHGGNIWVKSKEGEGTTVGFTVKPFTLVAEELKGNRDKDALVRTAHGWIKNHSLYRR